MLILFFRLLYINELLRGRDVVGVAWQTSALPVRVQVSSPACLQDFVTNIYLILLKYTTQKMIANIFFWLLIAWAWVWSIYYSSSLAEFGRVSWAENNLWWTRQLYVLVWFIIMVIGLMTMFWLVNIGWDPTTLQYNQVQ